VSTNDIDVAWAISRANAIDITGDLRVIAVRAVSDCKLLAAEIDRLRAITEVAAHLCVAICRRREVGGDAMLRLRELGQLLVQYPDDEDYLEALGSSPECLACEGTGGANGECRECRGTGIDRRWAEALGFCEEDEP
jgi:hypothetical protein